MQPLIWDRRPDGLRAPALVCAFKGWNDAGDAASAALTFLGAQLEATRFARVDLAEALGVQMVVTLGALLADVAHTAPVPITGLASDEGLVERLGLQRS